jgi:hypothetical protein
VSVFEVPQLVGPGDVAPRPLDDPAKHKLQYAGNDQAERQITEVLKWVQTSKLLDY